MLYWVFLTPVNFKVQRSKEEGKPHVEGKKGGEGNTGTKRILLSLFNNCFEREYVQMDQVLHA